MTRVRFFVAVAVLVAVAAVVAVVQLAKSSDTV